MVFTSSSNFALFSFQGAIFSDVVGVFNDEGPPVPIPNTEVKLISAENTWLEAARENRAVPTQREVKECATAHFFTILTLN